MPKDEPADHLLGVLIEIGEVVALPHAGAFRRME
jgi:hypothetical protein